MSWPEFNPLDEDYYHKMRLKSYGGESTDFSLDQIWANNHQKVDQIAQNDFQPSEEIK